MDPQISYIASDVVVSGHVGRFCVVHDVFFQTVKLTLVALHGEKIVVDYKFQKVIEKALQGRLFPLLKALDALNKRKNCVAAIYKYNSGFIKCIGKLLWK